MCGTTASCPLHCSDCGGLKDTPITYTFCSRCTERRDGPSKSSTGCFACHGTGTFEPDADEPMSVPVLTCAECNGTGIEADQLIPTEGNADPMDIQTEIDRLEGLVASWNESPRPRIAPPTPENQALIVTRLETLREVMAGESLTLFRDHGVEASSRGRRGWSTRSTRGEFIEVVRVDG